MALSLIKSVNKDFSLSFFAHVEGKESLMI